MRIVNENHETIKSPDLSVGYLVKATIIREDATPIDNVTKWAWDDSDYEEVQMYIPNREKSVKEQIAELKAKLSATDYKVIKCSECQLLGQEMPYDVAELHAERQTIRDEINKLEQGE